MNTFRLTHDQIVDFPTRQSNTLYIFLTIQPSLIELCVPIAGISDHEAVLTKPNINIIAHKQSRRKIYLWNRTDSNLIRAFFCDFCNEFLNSNSINTPMNQLWSNFQFACHFGLNNLVPSKLLSNKTFHQPWITTFFIDGKDMPMPITDDHKPLLFGYAIKLSKILLKRMPKSLQQLHISWDSLTPTPQETLRNYGHKLKDKRWTTSAYLPCIIMVMLSLNPSTKPTFLITTSAQFLPSKIYHLLTCQKKVLVLTCNLYRFLLDTRQLLTSLEVHKAPGPDQIPPHLLQLDCHEIAPILKLIFNLSLHQGELP